MRVYIEYQYAESFQFMTLFPSFQREQDKMSHTIKPTVYSALWYAEYLNPENKRERAINFPKVLILEQL